MKFIKTQGDLFNSSADAIINTVNCVGVMGAGLALQFKNRFPKNYSQYVADCKKEILKIGHSTFFQENDKCIINFPTKDHWKNKSQLSFIKVGLEDLAFQLSERKIKSIAIPPLGCGLGGLDKKTVERMIMKVFNSYVDLECECFLYNF